MRLGMTGLVGEESSASCPRTDGTSVTSHVSGQSVAEHPSPGDRLRRIFTTCAGDIEDHNSSHKLNLLRRRNSLAGPVSHNRKDSTSGSTDSKTQPRRRSINRALSKVACSDQEDRTTRSESTAGMSSPSSSLRASLEDGVSGRRLDDVLPRNVVPPRSRMDRPIDGEESDLSRSARSSASASISKRPGGKFHSEKGVSMQVKGAIQTQTTLSCGQLPDFSADDDKESERLVTPSLRPRRRLSLGNFMSRVEGGLDDAVTETPSASTPTRSLSRLSFGSFMSLGINHKRVETKDLGSFPQADPASTLETPRVQTPRRRLSLSAFGNREQNSNKTQQNHNEKGMERTPDGAKSLRRRASMSPFRRTATPRKDEASSNGQSRPRLGIIPSGHSEKRTDPYELINMARERRGMPSFSRNMLMDSVASQVATGLARSNGQKCIPTNFHGNIGQGASLAEIHKTMMRKKGETARANILAKHFTEMGIGVATSKTGIVFLCHLFK